jgi:hypothetical protein
MKLNKKGYSIIEMFAVIFIASAIIFPMMTTLVSNLEINDRMHNRRSAAAIAQGTLEGFTRLDYYDIESMVVDANNASTYYISFDNTNCTQLSDTNDQAVCNQLFNTIFNNLQLDSDQFKVYIHNYNINQTMKTALLADPNIPDSVKAEINNLEAVTAANPDLYYIYVWIEYDVDTSSTIVLRGLISNE